jgi:hypothetical protein
MLHIDAQDDVNPEELDQLTDQLRAELEDLDIESVSFVHGQLTPPGAKVLDPITIGALAIVVLPAVLPKVVEFIQAWTLRSEVQSVKIKAQHGDESIEVEFPKTMTPEEAKKHIDTVVDALSKSKHH